MSTLDDDKLKVLEASDIAEVVGEYVRLVPNGREFKCLCPFHDDNNPSMYVVPHKRMFHCFVCGAGGDVFTFIQRYHGIGFGEAIRMLAERAGIELTPRRERRPRRDAQGRDEPEVSRTDLLEANRVADGFFRAILRDHPGGQAARGLVERRGIAPEMIERFGLGAAPDRWDGLLATIDRRGLAHAPFLAAGLLKKKERPQPYDAMRNRLIFPIHGETGEAIAFGGRRVNDEDDPKYLNSPESPLFNKSKTLYGLPMARQAIRDSGRAVVVEGYTDVIACHQAGLANVVGTLGTAFTAGHAQKLRSQCHEVVLLFDGDEAGQNAADRAIDVLIAARVDIRVAMLGPETGAKDPDELLARDGGEETLRGVIDRAEPVLDRWARRIREKTAEVGPATRGRLLDDQIARLGQVGLETLSPIERTSMLGSLADALGVPHRIVEETYDRTRRPGRRAGGAIEPKPVGYGGEHGGEYTGEHGGEHGGETDEGPIVLRPIDRFRLQAISCLFEHPDPAGLDRGRVGASLRVGLDDGPRAIAGAVHAVIRAFEEGRGLTPDTLLAALPTREATAAVAAELLSGDGAENDLESCLERLEEHGLRSASGGAGGVPDPVQDRLSRLRTLHQDHGGNRVANPYRFGAGHAAPRRTAGEPEPSAGAGGGAGPEDSGTYHRDQHGPRSEDGQNQPDDAGAAPGPH